MTGWLQSLNLIKSAHELCFPLLHYSFPLLHYSFTLLFLSCPFNISGSFLYAASHVHTCSVASVVSDSLWPHGQRSLPGSSVHGIFQARILGWVAMPSSRESSQPRDWSQVSFIAGHSLPLSHWGKPSLAWSGYNVYLTLISSLEFQVEFLFIYLWFLH